MHLPTYVNPGIWKPCKINFYVKYALASIYLVCWHFIGERLFGFNQYFVKTKQNFEKDAALKTFCSLPGPFYFYSFSFLSFNAHILIINGIAWPFDVDHLFLSQYKDVFEVRKSLTEICESRDIYSSWKEERLLT